MFWLKECKKPIPPSHGRHHPGEGDGSVAGGLDGNADAEAVDDRVRLRRVACYCFLYGLPSAAGGTVRPITPATAMSVRTYGRVWKSVAAAPE